MRHSTRTIDLGSRGFAATCTCGWKSQPTQVKSKAQVEGNTHYFDANVAEIDADPRTPPPDPRQMTLEELEDRDVARQVARDNAAAERDAKDVGPSLGGSRHKK